MSRKTIVAAGLILEGVLLCIDYCHFGIIRDFWYVMLGTGLICASKTALQARRNIWCAAIILAFALYVFQLPEISYYQAVETLCQKEGYDMNMLVDMREHRKLAWDYEYCEFSHPNYLIGFKARPMDLLWYDPYTGEYGIIDVAENFPFIAEEMY